MYIQPKFLNLLNENKTSQPQTIKLFIQPQMQAGEKGRPTPHQNWFASRAISLHEHTNTTSQLSRGKKEKHQHVKLQSKTENKSYIRSGQEVCLYKKAFSTS